MCGIAGYVGPRRPGPDAVARGLALMRRRGPDDAAHRTWTVSGTDRAVTVLHTRLNIIDLAQRSNQPLRIGSKLIVYNGELYNYRELRVELERAGVGFATESDTEVLLAAIDHWGWTAGLDRCEGMWALAVYDEADASLTLARDRFGEKPLYLYRREGGLYFGSETKFIAALSDSVFDPDIDHLCRYLVNGYKALYKQPRTFFRALTEVPPATILTVAADGRETLTRYWEPGCAPDDAMTYAEAVAGARQRLLRSIEIRLRADVPLAFCMSGGVDSNALISIARRVFDFDVHGLTIVDSDARYDEQALVDHVVAELGIRHTAIPVDTRDFLPKLRRLVRQHDAPVYTITYYAHWLLMEAIAAHGYRICLSGTGADELFTGYYDHHLAYFAELPAGSPLRATAVDAWRRTVQPLVRNPNLADPDLLVDDPAFRGHFYQNADQFSGYLHAPWAEPFRETAYTPLLLRNRMLNELFHEATPVILHEEDLNAMYYSIENRSPYLDRALFEFCNTIPTRHLIQRGVAKAVLRDAVRGVVPDRIVDNPRKVGFNASILSFLDAGDPEARAEILKPSPIFEHLRRDPIERMLERPELSDSESKFLFCFLSAKLFLEEFGA